MKKLCILILIVFVCNIFTTACGKKQTANMIQSKRRFAEIASPDKTKTNGVIDLSEGPKLNYDAKLGPQNLNFDIKIVDPY